jgi:hypothetical protein
MSWYGVFKALEDVDRAVQSGDAVRKRYARELLRLEVSWYANPNTPGRALHIALEKFVAENGRLPKGTRIWKRWGVDAAAIEAGVLKGLARAQAGAKEG